MNTRILFLFLISPLLSPAQKTRVSDEYPHWGNTIEVYYNPDSTVEKPVFVLLNRINEDFSRQSETIRLAQQGEGFGTSVTVSKGNAALGFTFQVGDEYDYSAQLYVIPISETGKRYRNGNVFDLMHDPKAYQKELSDYPDNYTVYRIRWQLLGMIAPDSADAVIAHELEEIGRTGQKNDAYYYAMTCGNAQLGEMDAARSNLQTLMDRFPDSYLVIDGYSYYTYQLFSKSQKDSLLAPMVDGFIKAHPKSQFALNNIQTLYNGDEIRDKPLLRQVAAYGIETAPDAPMPYVHYANALDMPEEKRTWLGKATDILFDQIKRGKLRDSELPAYFYSLARGYKSAGDFRTTLDFLKFVEDLAPQQESGYYQFKGNTLNALGRKEDALETYFRAASMGLEAGRDSAWAVYRKLGRKDEDFDYYLEVALKKIASREDAPTAPAFDVTDMAGNPVDLESLKGKVVVLNFWFIGCAPCRVEMPGLNQLVQDYAGQDVAFIAFASDDKRSLEKFLQKTTFDYRVIPAAMQQSADYKVKGYPTHILIDKKGRIRNKLMGGSEDRHEHLRPLIDRLLGE